MPVSLAPSEIVQEVMRNGLNPKAFADVIEALGGEIGDAVAIGSDGAVIGADAAVAGTAFIDATVVLIVGGVLIAVLLYAAVRRVLLGIVGGINLPWGIPQHLQHIVAAIFPDPGPLVQWVDDKLGQLAGSLWRGWIQWLDTILPHTNTVVNLGSVTAPTSPNLSPLWQAVHQLQAANAYQQQEISALQARLGATVPVPAPNLVPLEQVVDNLSARLTAQQQQIGQLLTNQQVQGQALTQFSTELAQLSRELHAVSLTVTNWPEIEQGLQQQLSTLQQTTIALEGDVAEHTFRLTHLWPLDALTYAGAVGIENLVKLERNPCQCPKFLDIPNELGTALAVYQFLTAG